VRQGSERSFSLAAYVNEWSAIRRTDHASAAPGSHEAWPHDRFSVAGYSGVDEIFVNTSALPGLIVVCFGRFWVRGLPFPNARHLGHPFQWKNTLPWHLGLAAKVRIFRFKNLPSFRDYRGLQNHV